ncbi:MAG: tricarballylate dehydrogenase [Betaproteobacteria bacterium RIFCSPLOWO2_12_FULL_62_13]|nr:MAG: tricarballylate dehydrogenase [Betaproteobacteria bacterium RIFCSPLOWO2_12_FULL_62_13]
MQLKDCQNADVVVVGAGNAALCAALAAHEAGVRVVILEKAPESESGGNSYFTGGAFRIAHDNIGQLREVLDISEEEARTTDFGMYSESKFLDDVFKATEYRCDPDLVEILVRQSRHTVSWLKRKGVRFEPTYHRQAVKVGTSFRFIGGQICGASGEGEGLVQSQHALAQRAGVPILYDTAAVSLLYRAGQVRGVVAASGQEQREITAGAVVLACGGFESNAEMRARYLGPGWDLAKVRGTRYNMGDGIAMALNIGAMPYGHWSGAHAVGWDLNAPPFGDRKIGDVFQKHSYPYGIMVNANGERFVDEGSDFRNFTYAKYGQEILKQPGMFAWQIFDSKMTHLLRDQYRVRQVTKVEAMSLQELAQELEGVDKTRLLETISKYNQAVRQDIPFDLAVKDGRCTVGLPIPKSNWANTIDTPPFQAYAVTCGITCTFGGVQISPRAAVQNVCGKDIPGLYAAGEMVGGLFYFNCPSGTGLVAGAVFGRIAGTEAARFCKHN